MWTEMELLFTLYFRYYTQIVFVTRLIINKVQWVNFKFENVIVSLHSLKTMGLGHFGGSIILRNGELLRHSPMRKIAYSLKFVSADFT